MAEKKRRFWQPITVDEETIGWVDFEGNLHSESESGGHHHHPQHNNQSEEPEKNKNKTNPNSGAKKSKRGLFR